MAPTKAKGKNVKGVMVLVSPTKRMKKAGNKRQVCATTLQDQNMTIDEEVAVSGQDKVAQKI